MVALHVHGFVTALWLALPLAVATAFARRSRAFLAQCLLLATWAVSVGWAAWGAFPPSASAAQQPTLRELLYLPVAGCVILAAMAYDRRHGLRIRFDPRGGAAQAFWSALVVASLTVAGATAVAGLSAGTPRESVVLPLPPGLHAVRQGEGCGSDTCTLGLKITSSDAQSTRDIVERLRRHLRGRGWRLDGRDSACRPSGPFDVASTCVQIFTMGNVTTVEIDVSDIWS